MNQNFGKGDKGFVTFQFSGICTLGLFKDRTAKVWLLNADAIKKDDHRPVLTVPGTRMTKSLEGLPDSVVMFPETDLEYGVWSLKNTDIRIESDIQGTLPQQVTVVEDGTWNSISRLVDIAKLAKSGELVPQVPATATFDVRYGDLRAVDPGDKAKLTLFEFKVQGVQVEPLRPYASQFQWRLPAKDKVTVYLRSGGGTRAIEIEADTRVTVSNACFCEETGHLLAHYEVVKAKQRPELRAEPPADMHEDPFDIRCASGQLRVD